MWSRLRELSMDKQKRLLLVACNCAMILMWGRVLRLFLSEGWNGLASNEESSSSMPSVCDDVFRRTVLRALALTGLEFTNALVGLTRSSPLPVLLFVSVRLGTEYWVAPLIGCGAWQHLFTVLCWASGDIVRFGCFAVDSALESGSYWAKSVRYTVGPIVFPLGTLGEFLMVLAAASNGRPLLYGAAALWPVGFYPLMKQLLKQRKKHFTKLKKPEIKMV